MRCLGIISGLIAAVVMFFLIGKDDPDLLIRITFSLTIGWIIYNVATYTGRYRPKIVYALKVCYPIFIWYLLMCAIGKI